MKTYKVLIRTRRQSKFRFRDERGQALLEGLIVLSFLVTVTYGILECIRILAFKSLLFVGTQEAAIQISNRLLQLERQGVVEQSAERDRLARVVSSEMKKYLKSFPTGYQEGFPVRVDISLHRPGQPKGVFVTSQSCLNLFFIHPRSLRSGTIDTVEQEASQFQRPTEYRASRESNSPRNCLGQFDANSRRGLSISASAFSPEPASSLIFKHGIHDADELRGFQVTSGASSGLAGAIGDAINIGFRPFIRIANTLDAHHFLETPEDNSMRRVEASLYSENFVPESIVQRELR